MLEDILQKYFGCKKPFLKKKRICGYYIGNDTRVPDYEYLTRAGGKAYGKLTSLLYDLEKMLGADFDTNRWIALLDEIVDMEDAV